MKLTCKSCRYSFSIDERNIDTEKVECPRCRWLNVVSFDRFQHGYFGRFAKTGARTRRNVSIWPKREE